MLITSTITRPDLNTHTSQSDSVALRPVFGAQKPKAQKTEDVKDVFEVYQGLLPNCQALAADLIALKENADILNSIRRKQKDGTDIYRFPGAPDKQVIVRPEEVIPIQWKKNFRPAQVKAHRDIRSLEVAYARLLKTSFPDRFKDVDDNDIRSLYNSPDFDPELFTTAFAYKMLTGKDMSVYVRKDPSGKTERLIKKVFTDNLQRDWKKVTLSEKKYETDKYKQIVKEQLTRYANDPSSLQIALVSNPGGNELLGNGKPRIDWGRMVPSYHVFIVDEVNLTKKQVILRHSHNSKYGLVLPLKDIVPNFFKMYVAEKN